MGVHLIDANSYSMPTRTSVNLIVGDSPRSDGRQISLLEKALVSANGFLLVFRRLKEERDKAIPLEPWFVTLLRIRQVRGTSCRELQVSQLEPVFRSC